MDGSDDLQRARDRKRVAENQAVKGEEDRFAAEEEPKDPPPKASAEVMANRRIVRVKVPEGITRSTGIFSNVGGGPVAPSAGAPALVTKGFGSAPQAPSATPATAPSAAPSSASIPNPFAANPFAAKPPASEASKPSEDGQKPAVSPTSLNAKPDGKGIPSVFGKGSNFTFSFSAPASSAPAPAPKPAAAAAPAPQLQPKEASQDPDTRTLCEEPLKLHHKAGDEWVERGDVVVKVVVNTAGEKPWAMVGAFAAKTKRQVLHAPIGSAFKLGKRAERQVTFVCLEAGGSKPEVFVLRAPKDADARIDSFLNAVAAAQKELGL